MSSIRVDRLSNNANTSLKVLKNVGHFAKRAAIGAVGVVALSVIGPFGAIGALSVAGYKVCRSNYHMRHTREKNHKGVLLQGTELLGPHNHNEKNYMNPLTIFNQNDLSRLINEKKRLQDEKVASVALGWTRCFAKCSIPLVGPIWAYYTEFRGKKFPFKINVFKPEESYLVDPEQCLDFHIGKLKN